MRYRRWGCAAIAVLILGVEAVIVAIPWLMKWETAIWMADHVADNAQLVMDLPDQEITSLFIDNLIGQRTFGRRTTTWHWTFDSSAEGQFPPRLQGLGVQYLLIDERTFPGTDFSKRIQTLVGQGATLVYESPDVFHLGLRKAVLWTFRPDHPLNVIIGGNLLLMGYNVSQHADGGISLLLHWYTLAQSPIAYHVYLHYLDVQGAEVSVQDDTDMGNGTRHTTNAWGKNEIVFVPLEIGNDKLAKLSKPYHLRLGFYREEDGTRAMITDDAQHTLGDHINLDLP